MRLEIEQPPNPAFSFENRLFEDENTQSPTVQSNSAISSIIAPIQNVANKNGHLDVENVGKVGGKGWPKKIRNGIFFGLIFLILMALVALGMRHLTQKENFDAELEHLWSSKEDLELQNELMVGQENHLEWQRNESRIHLEHIELQRKLLAHKVKENGTMAEKLENAETSLHFCKSQLESTTKAYWNYQEKTWKKQEEIRKAERRLRLHQNRVDLHTELIKKNSEDSENEFGKINSLEQEMDEKEEKLKGLEVQAEDLKMLVANLNGSVEKLGEMVAAKKAEMEIRDSKLRKLDEESTLLRLMNESQTAKMGLIKSLKDQLAQKDAQIQALESLAHFQGKTEATIRKIFLDSKNQVHLEKLRRKEEQIAEMEKSITGLKAELEKKQKDIEEAHRRVSRLNNCYYYRHWC